MGAHSLGRSRIGWQGTFTGPPDGNEKTHFDERYYHHMIDKEFAWKNEVNSLSAFHLILILKEIFLREIDKYLFHP